MSIDKDWTPGFGEIVTWFAMDKAGAIAVMVNNCFGRLPAVLLALPDLEPKLDRLSEYMWEESAEFDNYPENKQGKTILGLYSARTYRHLALRAEVEALIGEHSSAHLALTEYNLPSIKGFYVYHGVEGSVPNEDYPVGYQGQSQIGDYFRYLLPTVTAGINDIPAPLRGCIAVCESFEFSELSFWPSDLVDTYFSQLYV